MRLQAPPDFTKPLVAVAIGVSIAVAVNFITRSNLPHVGDNLHHLPHGGCYVDGTKRITYNSPGGPPAYRSFWPFLTVILLTGALLLRGTRTPRPCACPHCTPTH